MVAKPSFFMGRMLMTYDGRKRKSVRGAALRAAYFRAALITVCAVVQ
jgi:hypothetical protein